MKKIFTFIMVAMLSGIAYAQSPQKISYQAVVRNTAGTLVAQKPVGVRISIIQTTEFGPSVYVETHTPITNLNGLFTISIGAGTVVTGTFNTIDWSKGPYFVKTEIDPNGSTSYAITGTQQLLSVPYALYTEKSRFAMSADTAKRAKVSDSVSASAKVSINQLNSGGANSNDHLKWNGTSWVPAAETTLNAGNGIGISNGKIGTAWSSGASGPYTDSLYVGIGTRNPFSRLHVSGSGYNVISSNFEGSAWNSFYKYSKYIGYLGVYNDSLSLDFGTSGSGTNVNIVTGATPRLTVTPSGYVGIGTTTPSTTLDVNGKTRTTDLQITNGAGAGKILTSDASGNGTWSTGKIVAGVYPLIGSAGTGPYNSMSFNTYSFVGPTATITVTSTGDVIVGSAQVPIAATALINFVQFGMGYQLQPSGTILNFTGGNYSYISVGTERDSKSAAASVTNLAPGTYKVGVVISNTTTTAISNNDYVNGYFMLLK